MIWLKRIANPSKTVIKEVSLLITQLLSFIDGYFLGGNIDRQTTNFPISCFSCASEDYSPIYTRSKELFLFGQPTQFDSSCDQRFDLENFAPTIHCDSTCITVIEPQFFGGILNERKPYTFIRGCATDIFMLAINAKNREYNSPAEIDFLHRSEMCLWLPIGELWPELGGGFQSNSRGDQSGTSALSNAAGVGTEMVRVCSCTGDLCNVLDATSGEVTNSAQTISAYCFLSLLSFIIFFILLITA